MFTVAQSLDALWDFGQPRWHPPKPHRSGHRYAIGNPLMVSASILKPVPRPNFNREWELADNFSEMF